MALSKSLELLLDKVFDYSGIFPPANLSLEDAFNKTINFNKELKNKFWINSDLVLGYEKLDELLDIIKSKTNLDRHIKISVLSPNTIDNFEELFILIEKINNFQQNQKNLILIQSLETKITDNFLLLDNNTKDKLSYLGTNFSVSLEPDLSNQNWQNRLENSINFISLNKSNLLLKIRGTGPTKIENNKIAKVIKFASNANINLKATGGLHHPIIEKKLYENNLGFLNLSLAIFFAKTFPDQISEEFIFELLENDNCSSFDFSNGIAYKHLNISLSEVQSIKSTYIFSIGSCSINEPDDDINRLFQI
jgi:hypothetical protein